MPEHEPSGGVDDDGTSARSDRWWPRGPGSQERGFEILDGVSGGMGMVGALGVLVAIPVVRGSRWLYRRATRSTRS